MSESTELRIRAESLHLYASAFEVHAVNPTNSPTAAEAYERAMSALTDAYLALTGAADALDEDAGMRLPLTVRSVRRIPIRAGGAS